MKIILVFVTALLSTIAGPSQAIGAPAIPMVVCQLDKAHQILVPEYICRWQGGKVG